MQKLHSSFLMAVFPTGVGVFPYKYRFDQSVPGLPHRRGGVSSCVDFVTSLSRSSPQAWGCFHFKKLVIITIGVFPTGVGVFLVPKAAGSSS